METLRPLLLTYAYNICGSMEEARDIVQEAYLKFMQVDQASIQDEKAYLVRMVINLAINQKKKLQRQRAAYRGEWLPEPVVTAQADDNITRKEILSYSLMILLERLTAKQRAVFILKEAFDYEHPEIAAVLDISADHSRQLLSRAKKLLAAEDARVMASTTPAVLSRYLEIIGSGDTQRLEAFLHADVALYADGGGKASASLHPLFGREPVMALLLGTFRKFYADIRVEEVVVNHHPALLYFTGEDPNTCQIFDFDEEGNVTRIYMVRNPDKLRNILEKR